MRPGEVCQIEGETTTYEQAYEQMRSNQAHQPIGGIVFLTIGLVITIAYIVFVVRSVRRRQRSPSPDQDPGAAPAPDQQQTPALSPPPGWYPDPAGTPRTQRYWNGTQWGRTSEP